MGIFGLWKYLVLNGLRTDWLESWKSMDFRISRRKLPPRSENVLTASPSGPFNSLCLIVLIYKLRMIIFLVMKLKWDRHVHMPSTYLLRRDLTNATEIMIMVILVYFHAVTTSCVRLFNFELCLSHSASRCPPLHSGLTYLPWNPGSFPRFYDQLLLLSYKKIVVWECLKLSRASSPLPRHPTHPLP